MLDLSAQAFSGVIWFVAFEATLMAALTAQLAASVVPSFKKRKVSGCHRSWFPIVLSIMATCALTFRLRERFKEMFVQKRLVENKKDDLNLLQKKL